MHSPPALRALDLQVCPHTTLLPHKKTGAHLREHRSNLHVLWSFQPAPAPARRGRDLRLREALDAVLGDARKEQRLQLGSALAKDQSLTEDALALVKTAFIAG